MIQYKEMIFEMLPGDTPKKKYENLKELLYNENLVKKCFSCKRAPATHLGEWGQLKIPVCKKCGDKLTNMHRFNNLTAKVQGHEKSII